MYKLFIVEDEWLVLEGLKQTIPWEDMRCTVIGEARNGQAALEGMKANPPDILLTDIRMPAMDGIQLAEQAKALWPQVQLVFLTGFDDFSYAQKAIRLGAADFVLKPTNPDELMEVFGRLTSRLDEERRLQSLNRANAEADQWNRPGEEPSEALRASGFDDIVAYIGEHYGEEISLQSIAEQYHMSESHFSRLFKKQVGTSFLEYLTLTRVRHARELLKNPRFKIYEVSVKVGYQDARYFSQIFRKYTGETPTEFRKRLGIVSYPL